MEQKNPPGLEALRERIDVLDSQLLALLNERAQRVKDVARLKSEHGEEHCYRPEREARILRKLAAANPGPLNNEQLLYLFQQIMSISLQLEQPITVAYLGPEGTFTHAAALEHFGRTVNASAHASIEQVFREVEAGSCQYGVVPVENSIEGMVGHTLDMFVGSPLKVCGEVELRIRHHLLSGGSGIDEIETVCSHAQSLAQCRRWLQEHLSGVVCVEVGSNAEAARRAAREPGLAAVAGAAAAELYDLNVLASNIEDDPNNTTRFLVLGRHEVLQSGDDKTSLLLSAPNRPGALHGMLGCLAEQGVSLTRIESRPSRQATWEYVFFIDFEGHREDAPVRAALAQLRECASLVKPLGSYPRAVTRRG